SSCYGGGLYAIGSLTLTNTDLISNTSVAAGGGAMATGDATIDGARFERNACTGAGCLGGGLLAGANLSLMRAIFLNNTSLGDGGGLAASVPHILNSVSQGNACTGSGCLGGGLFIGLDASVRRSSFSGNTAAGSGGGLAITATSQITLANVTLSGNSAAADGG